MELVIDSHIHVYPCYRLETAFSTLMDRLCRVASNAIKIACLAERHDCDFYDVLSKESENILGPRFEVVNDSKERFVWVRRKSDGERLVVLPGRQIVSHENIEIIALNQTSRIPDGLPSSEIVSAVIMHGGTPMICWSPGKWFFHRAKIVENLLKQFSPIEIVIGDTSLRPRGWVKPFLMRKAEAMGFKVVAGSDPLPFPGEEQYFGSYVSHIKGSFSGESIPELIRNIPSSLTTSISLEGQRCTPIAFVRRLRKNAAAKRVH